jgi:hypothetical protein
VTGQHTSMTAERWAGFPFDKQVLMIGNEMNRASRLLDPRMSVRSGPAKSASWRSST